MYQTVDGKTAIEVMLSNDTVWLTIDYRWYIYSSFKEISRSCINVFVVTFT